LIESFIIKFNGLVPLFKALLQFLNLKLKLLLLVFVFGFQCEDLIVRLSGMLAALEGVLVDDEGFFLDLCDLLIHLHYAILGETIQS
jgi:hypothetical protein